MKKQLILPILSTFIILMLSPSIKAQPLGEQLAQTQQLAKMLTDNELGMSCERRVKQGRLVELTTLQFYPYLHRLISTITVAKNRSSWSAQVEIIGLRMAKGDSEQTHLKLAQIQKGQDRWPELHLQMDLQEGDFELAHLQRQSKLKFQALTKGDLEHPFMCQLHKQNVR